MSLGQLSPMALLRPKRDDWEPVQSEWEAVDEWEPVQAQAADEWEPVQGTGFHPLEAAKSGFVTSTKGMLSSLDRGREAWLEYTKQPVVATTLKIISPITAVMQDVERATGAPEFLAKRAAERDATVVPSKEASFRSVTDDPSFASLGNYLTYQLASLPSQMGPGMLSGLAGGLIGGKFGAQLAAFSTSYVQNSGELYGNLLDQGVDKETAARWAHIGGLPMAMLDTAVVGWMSGKIANKLVARKVSELALKESLLKSTVKTAAKGTIAEGVTEAAQEAISAGVESGVTNTPFLTKETAWRLIDAGLAGAIMGGVVGGVAGAVPQQLHRGKDLQDFRTEDAERKQKLEDEKLRNAAVDEKAFIDNQRAQADEQLAESDADVAYWEAFEKAYNEAEQGETEQEVRAAENEVETLAVMRDEWEAVVPEAEEAEIAPTEQGVVAQPTPQLPSIHDVINERNVEYHATDLEGFKGILEKGEIGQPLLDENLSPNKQAMLKAGTLEPGPALQVSTSRIARIASKADKGITFVLDSSKMPKGRPTTEHGYKKIDTTAVLDSPLQGKGTWTAHFSNGTSISYTNKEEAPGDKISIDPGAYITFEPASKYASVMGMNKRFEFENRYSQPIPLSAVKAVLVDRSALEGDRTVGPSEWFVESPDIGEQTPADVLFRDKNKAQEYATTIPGATIKAEGVEGAVQKIQQLASFKGIPVRIYESGREMHTSRARMQLELTNLRADQVLERIKARMQARGPGFFRDETGEVDPQVFADLVEYGMLRMQAGVQAFEAWSQEMLQHFGETIQPILQDVYNAARARVSNTELANTPAYPATEKIIAAIKPSTATAAQAENIRADLDRFGWFSRKFLHVLQWGWRNPHNKQLQQYIDGLHKMVAYADGWRMKFNDTVTKGKKLSAEQSKALANMTYDMTLWSDRIRHAPTEDELNKKRIEVARKYGVKEETMKLYLQIRLDLLEVLHESELSEIARIERVFRGQAETTEMLREKARQIADVQDMFARMREKEYFPISRFGKWAVIVKAKERVKFEGRTYAQGALVNFEFFEHRKAVPRMPQSWYSSLDSGMSEAKKKYPSRFFDVYEWKTPETIDTLAYYPAALYRAIEEKLGLTEEQQQLLTQIVLKSSPTKAFIQHWNRRKGVAGFSRDMWRTYAAYGAGAANFLARNRYRDDLNQAIIDHGRTITRAGVQTGSAIKRQQIQDAIKAHFEDLMHPRNYAPSLRSWAFMLYFMYNPKQAIVNLTQLPVFAYPYFVGMLTRDGVPNGVADAQVVKELTQACYDVARLYQGKTAGIVGSITGAITGWTIAGPAGAGIGANIGGAAGLALTKQGEFAIPREAEAPRKTNLTPSEIRLLQRAQEMGLTNQGYSTMLSSVAGGSTLVTMAPLEPVDRLFKAVNENGTMLFRASEQFNRLVTVLAASRLAASRGLNEDATLDFARDAIWRTMFAHEAWARPEMLRGKLSVVTIFKTFLQNALFALAQNPGRMRSMLMMGILGGMMGLPGAEDLMRLIDWSGTWINKLFFDNNDPRVDTQKTVRETFAQLEMDPDLLMHGLARNSFGFPYLSRIAHGPEIPSMDFSSSLSMGRIVPGIEPITKAALGMMSPQDFTYRLAQDVMGVVGTMGNGAMRYAFDDSANANLFWRLLMPQFIRHSMFALEAERTGTLTDNRGNELVRFDINNPEQRNELFMMPLGVAPARVARMREGEWARYEAVKFYESWKQEIINAFATAIIRGEPMNKAQAMLVRYNTYAPPDMAIANTAIMSAVKERIKGRTLDSVGLPTKQSYFTTWEQFNEAYGETKP